MQSGEQRVHGPDTAFGGYKEVRPAFAGVCNARPVRDGFERPHHRGSDRDDPSLRLVGGVDKAGGRGRHPVKLLVGRFVRFQTGDAGVQDQGRDLHAAGDETGY